MADRATTLTGMFQKVTMGPTSKVLGCGTYEISGLNRRTVDVSEFGVDCDIFEFGCSSGGTITLANVAYDPTDPMQSTIQLAVEQGTKLDHSSTSGLRFWINSTSWLAVGTSGHIMMTNAGGVKADRNGVARTDFSGLISGAFVYLDGNT